LYASKQPIEAAIETLKIVKRPFVVSLKSIS